MATSTAEETTTLLTVRIPKAMMKFVREQVKAGVRSSESEYVEDVLLRALHEVEIGDSAEPPSFSFSAAQWIVAERKKTEEWWANLSEQRRKEIEDLIDEGLQCVERGEVSEHNPEEFRKEMMELIELHGAANHESRRTNSRGKIGLVLESKQTQSIPTRQF